ncbi:MAG: TolC family protein [Candidatus Cloacimonetes bacterium]|nr:TolC family protein [Candidatus Cloacimonadota bacterium]
MKSPIFFVLLLIPLLLPAQVYKLEDLISEKLEATFNYQETKANMENSKSQLRSSYYEILPSATVSASKAYNKNSDSKNASLNISKSLSLNEPTYFNINTSSLNKKNSLLTFEKKVKQTVYDILGLYLSLIETQESIKIQESIYAIKLKNHQMTESLMELGKATILDLQSSEISLLDTEINIKELKTSFLNKRRDFFRTLEMEDEGYPFESPTIGVTEEIQDYKSPVEIEIERNQLKITKLNLLQNRLSLLPDLYISASYSYSFTGNNENSLLNNDYYDDNYGISFNVSYPLFNQLKQRENVSRLRRNKIISELRLNLQEKKFVDDYNSLKQEYMNAIEVYDIIEKKMELAEKNYQLAEKRYELNLISQTELEDSQNRLLESELAKLKQLHSILLKKEYLNLFLSDKILNRW